MFVELLFVFVGRWCHHVYWQMVTIECLTKEFFFNLLYSIGSMKFKRLVLKIVPEAKMFKANKIPFQHPIIIICNQHLGQTSKSPHFLWRYLTIFSCFLPRSEKRPASAYQSNFNFLFKFLYMMKFLLCNYRLGFSPLRNARSRLRPIVYNLYVKHQERRKAIWKRPRVNK